MAPFSQPLPPDSGVSDFADGDFDPLRATSARPPAARPLSGWSKAKRWLLRASTSFWLPTLLLAVFFALIVAAFAYQKNQQIDREAELTQEDLRAANGHLTERLSQQRAALTKIANAIQSYSSTSAARNYVNTEAQNVIAEYPEIYAVHQVNAQAQIIAGYASPKMVNGLLYAHGDSLEHGLPHQDTYQRAVDSSTTSFSPAILYGLSFDTVSPRAFAYEQSASVQLMVPIPNTQGDVLLAEYAVDGLYRYALPNEIMGRYALSITDTQGTAYTGSLIVENPNMSALQRMLSVFTRRDIPTHRLSIPALDDELTLQAQNFRSDQNAFENMIWVAITALGVLMSWIMISSWRHNRWRARTQSTLKREMLFRRAVEQSMLTGLRVVDMNKRITHVNAAFSDMTGFDAHELLGTTPPYPYWPKAERKNLTDQLKDNLGQLPTGGYEIELQQKSGELFDGFMHISPLIDENGAQTGWVTSLTDITEANRIKDELSQAHERFAKVLNSMDSSVSVVGKESGELLFSNRIYQQWFGPDQHGTTHAQLLELMPVHEESWRNSQFDDGEMHVKTHEVFVAEWGKWLNLQTRPLRWTDGSPAIMLLATDVTARKNAQEINAVNMAKLQANSHLVTMGEMASSVAHELNQPLTAISNYSTGILKRMEGDTLSEEMLQSALNKIAKQAERAANIIRRIREFIKRSEPKRTAVEVGSLLYETKEMVEVDMLRRRCQLNVEAEADLPTLFIDPLLIQQVLVNLIKNAGEAIDKAEPAIANRRILLRSYPETLRDQAAIAFAVSDTGPGLDPEVQSKLFDAFYSTKTEGMGIGLNLCRSIVEAHMGKIEAENTYNEQGDVMGCVFRFVLPLAGNSKT